MKDKELKTLKDLKVKENQKLIFKDGTSFILTSREADLINYFLEEIERAEAVKWIKKIKRFEKEDFDKNTGTLRWIKHFFNITEEDLK